MKRKQILARIVGVSIVILIGVVGVVIYSYTRGMPVALHAKTKLDSMVIVHQSKAFTVRDAKDLTAVMTTISSSRKYKADSVNTNRDLIIVHFYLASGKHEALTIIENVYHGDLLVADWTYFKNDSFISAIKKHIPWQEVN